MLPFVCHKPEQYIITICAVCTQLVLCSNPMVQCSFPDIWASRLGVNVALSKTPKAMTLPLRCCEFPLLSKQICTHHLCSE